MIVALFGYRHRNACNRVRKTLLKRMRKIGKLLLDYLLEIIYSCVNMVSPRNYSVNCRRKGVVLIKI